MVNLQTILLVFHVLVAVLLIGMVLFQRGKGADAGAGFGAGASGTVFGARGSANFLSRTTAVLATLFFCTSLGLAYLGSQREVPTGIVESVVGEEQAESDLPVLESAPVIETNELPPLPDLDYPSEAGAAEDDSSGLPGSTDTE